MAKKQTGRRSASEYGLWLNMRNRCSNPEAHNFQYYGGRGIRVCREWDDFDVFIRDVGPRPSNKHELDRVDNERGYEPGNVRWVTKVEQANNKRTNTRWTLNGETRTIAEWSRVIGIKQSTLCMRIARGWSVERTLTTVL